MDELEKNIPDDFWRKTFDQAAETPPPRVWASIERQLDESKSPRIIPLWGFGQASSRPLLWGTGIAAALALLLVGWWAIDRSSVNQPVAQSRSASQPADIALNKTGQTHSSAQKSVSQPQQRRSAADELSADELPFLAGQRGHSSTHQAARTEPFMAQLLTRTHPTYSVHRSGPAFKVSADQVTTDEPALPANSLVTTSPVGRIFTAELLPGRAEAMAFQELKGRPLRLRSPGLIQRIVWSRPADQPSETALTKGKRKAKELWASVSAMPGAFNPMVALRSAPMPTASYNSAAAFVNSNQPTINSRANFSVAYQASAGVQLSERWSVESGVGYLSGRSTVETPVQSAVSNFVQVANTNRDAGSSVYVNALRNSASNNMAYASPATTAGPTTADSYLITGNYTNQARQTLTNDYEYVQVPVQVGYQLRPRKKVSLAVLGGLLTNVFVRNTVGSDVVVKAKDGIYKPVALAATMGARVRYRPSGRWSASMAGLYQPSLSSGTEADSQVQSHPTSTGMSFGLDYHF